MRTGSSDFRGWQWIFISEALPALILSMVVLFYLTDDPAQAKWLADDERDWLVSASYPNGVNARRCTTRPCFRFWPIRAC